MNTNATTNFIRFSEPTMRSNASQAYSQCLPEPEPNYGYSQEPNYGYDSYYGEQAPLPQQPVQAPIGQPSSSSAGKGLLFVAGLAVVGAAAFGGIYLMNSTSAEPTASTSAAPAAAQAPVVNLPSAVDIPALAPAQSAPAPVIINNPAPIRVSGPVSSPRSIAAPKQIASSKPVTGQAPAAAPAPAPAPAAPAPAPKGPNGVAIKTPFAEVGAGQGGTSVKAGGVEVGAGQNGTSVKAGGVQVGVPGQNGGQVEVAVGQPETPAKIEGTTGGGETNPPAKTGGEETKQAGGGITDMIDQVVEAPVGGATDAASGIAGG